MMNLLAENARLEAILEEKRWGEKLMLEAHRKTLEKFNETVGQMEVMKRQIEYGEQIRKERDEYRDQVRALTEALEKLQTRQWGATLYLLNLEKIAADMKALGERLNARLVDEVMTREVTP